MTRRRPLVSQFCVYCDRRLFRAKFYVVLGPDSLPESVIACSQAHANSYAHDRREHERLRQGESDHDD